MPDSFEKSVDARAKAAAKKAAKAATKWKPESNTYHEKRGAELKVKYPLRIPKPPIPDDPTKEITVEQPEEELGYAHEAWVWHPEEKGLKGEWLKHQASFAPDGMLLKGMTHKTIQNTLAGEKDKSKIFKKPDGYYYRRPIEKK